MKEKISDLDPYILVVGLVNKQVVVVFVLFCLVGFFLGAERVT